MFRSILLAKSLTKSNFTKFIINESNFDSIKQQFVRKPQTSTFGSYFNYENAMPIFSIITSAQHLQKTHRIAILNQLEAMCQKQQSQKANSDQGLNLLANIHFHKSMELSLMGNFGLTLKELDAAIAIIQIMNYPNHFFLGQLHRSRGQSYLRLNDLTKSQHALLKAESILKLLLDDFLEEQEQLSNSKKNKQTLKAQIKKTRIALAHVLTQLANTYMKEAKIYESRSEIEKAIEIWSNVSNHKGISYYQLTIRIKSMLHIMFNERNYALQIENQLLQYLDDAKTEKIYPGLQKLNLARIWHMNFFVSNFKEQQSLQMYSQMKQKWQKRLIGLIKESKQKFKLNDFQNVMKYAGINQEKLAKYSHV